MDRRREMMNQKKYLRFRKPKYNNKLENETASGSKRGRPPHLRGKEIGLYYAKLNKKQENKPLATVILPESKKNEIKKLLSKVELKQDVPNKTKTESYSYIKDSTFKNKFLKIINGSIHDKLKYANSQNLTRNESLDKMFYDEFMAKKKTSKYKKILPFREKLPSYQKQGEIIHLVNNNQVVLISGETGCGKTTQVGQFILDDYILKKKGSICKIVCTQPRRISAISIAERVAEERAEKCGVDSVGYQIRLEKKLPRAFGSIVFCTTGVLLKQMETDPYLSEISHLILDEIHERDVVSDFLVTLIKNIITGRSDIKLILMSATLNSQQFSNYFDNCKMIEIPGFTYPVETFYLEYVLSKTNFTFPVQKEQVFSDWRKYLKQNRKKDEEFRNIVEPYVRNLQHSKKYPKKICDSLLNPNSEELNLDLIYELVKYICSTEPFGSILIFVPGFTDINKLNMLFINSKIFSNDKYIIITLHSKMPSIQQRQVFDRPPEGVRKIVISTNIAETSITIDDIIYVVDCGKIKITTYDVENDLEMLNRHWVSLANAKQRKGRAGRVQPGVCYHLFTKARESFFESYQLPEIKRTRLENIILRIKILQLGKAEEFFEQMMDPPHPKAVENAIKLLKQMNALDNEEKLTPLGYHLARLPLNPKMGKMILLGALFSCLDPIASIAASLDFKDAFYVPIGKQKEVDDKKRELNEGNKSDHLLLAEALRRYEIAKDSGTENDFCWRYFLNRYTLELLINMKSQFADYLFEMKFLTNNNIKSSLWNKNSKNLSLIKALVCASLYPNVAVVRKTNNKYHKAVKTIENERVKIHLGSVNSHETYFESPILVYHLKLKSSSIFLHDTTMVHPLSLLFFGDKIKIEDSNEETNISLHNNSLKFKCKRDTALLIIELRKHLDNLLQYKICHPGIVNWLLDSPEVSILRAITELITSEDIGTIFEDEGEEEDAEEEMNTD